MEKSISAMIHSLFMKLQSTSKSSRWDMGITESQIRVLTYIGSRFEKGMPTYQKDIEHEFGIRGSSVTSLLNNLEKNKWIKRESVDYDARLKSIVFDERAFSVMEQFKLVTEQLDGILRDSITDAEYIVFCQCMEKMGNAAKEHSNELSRVFSELVSKIKDNPVSGGGQ